MPVLTVCKAAPAVSYQPTPDTHIHIVAPLPEWPYSKADLTEIAGFHYEQARQLEEALHDALPGGTYDRLLGHMLQRKASHFQIAHK